MMDMDDVRHEIDIVPEWFLSQDQPYRKILVRVPKGLGWTKPVREYRQEERWAIAAVVIAFMALGHWTFLGHDAFEAFLWGAMVAGVYSFMYGGWKEEQTWLGGVETELLCSLFEFTDGERHVWRKGSTRPCGILKIVSRKKPLPPVELNPVTAYEMRQLALRAIQEEKMVMFCFRDIPRVTSPHSPDLYGNLMVRVELDIGPSFEGYCLKTQSIHYFQYDEIEKAAIMENED